MNLFAMAKGVIKMRKGIHPEYKKCTVTCDCGATFETESTKEEIHVEVCSACHPVYTGAQSKQRKTGSIEKFNKKYNIKDAQ